MTTSLSSELYKIMWKTESGKKKTKITKLSLIIKHLYIHIFSSLADRQKKKMFLNRCSWSDESPLKKKNQTLILNTR